MNSFTPVILGGNSSAPPIKRSPLIFPTCGSCPTPTSFDQDFAAIWPNGAPKDRDYLRANCWGIPIAGLPFVPGGSSEHPERFLSYFFPLYPTVFQEQWFTENQRRGYTHVVFSWPDARSRAGQSLTQFRADCQRARAAGFKVHVKLWSKDFDPANMTFDQFATFAEPMFSALAGVVDEYSPWEYDSNNLAGQTALDIHHFLGASAHTQGASFWCHFYPGHGFWGGSGETDWYQQLGADVDGLDLQTDQAWDIGLTQAHIVDHLRDVGLAGKKVRIFEPGTPSLMFSGDHPNEDEGDAFGYLTCCTKGDSKPWGFGAGARLADGSAI